MLDRALVPSAQGPVSGCGMQRCSVLGTWKAWRQGRMLEVLLPQPGTGEEDPPAPQEGTARNHIPLIRRFPLLPLLPRGGVGTGFIAGVWGQDFTSPMAS